MTFTASYVYSSLSDPAIVQIEPKGPGGWADYALLGSNAKTVVIFVEAKRLSVKDTPITQTVGYAVSENIENNANVRYCASTNGDTWEVYDITAQKSVMKASIATDDAAKCALKFLSLWRRSMADGVFDTAIDPVVAPVVIVDPTPVDPDPPSPQPPSPDWTPLNGNFETTGCPAPTAIMLPDGQQVVLTPAKWIRILVETALWLHRSGSLTKENCLIKSGVGKNSKRYILSVDGKHQGGNPFKSPILLPSTDITLEANLSSSAIIRNTQILLHSFGQDSSQIFLKLA